MTDAVFLIEYGANALHMDPHAEIANTGSIKQCGATEGHPVQSDQTQTLTTHAKSITTIVNV